MSMPVNMSKEEIGKILTNLGNNLEKESEDKHAKWVDSIVQEYDFLDIEKPEEFSLLVDLNFSEQTNVLAKKATDRLFETHLFDDKLKHRIMFIYIHYSFIERHLESLLSLEGIACIRDKTRWLIQLYKDYLVSGEMPKEVERDQYWLPNEGKMEEWINWIDSMYALFFGKAEAYLFGKYHLAKAYHQYME